MEKITLKALELAGFQNADMIAKIISYVPNPQTAVEMLLGVYTPTSIDVKNRFRNYRYSRTNEFAEIVGIDDLGDTITYKVRKQNTKRVWFLTEQDKKNKVYVTERPINSYDYTDVPANGYSDAEYTKSSKAFNDDWCNALSMDDAFTIMSDWLEFEKEPVVTELAM